YKILICRVLPSASAPLSTLVISNADSSGAVTGALSAASAALADLGSSLASTTASDEPISSLSVFETPLQNGQAIAAAGHERTAAHKTAQAPRLFGKAMTGFLQFSSSIRTLSIVHVATSSMPCPAEFLLPATAWRRQTATSVPPVRN